MTGIRYRSMQDRLFANSIPEHTGHVIDGEPSECWLWIGVQDAKGYGRISVRVDGKHTKLRAYRLAAFVFLGMPMDTPDTWDHECRMTACIHPNHGRMVSRSVNTKLAHARRREK